MTGRLQFTEKPSPRRLHAGCTCATADLPTGSTAGVVAESGLRLKNRQWVVRSYIAGEKIPCKVQKLLGFSVVVAVRGGCWRRSEGGLEDMAARPRSHHGTVLDRQGVGGGRGESVRSCVAEARDGSSSVRPRGRDGAAQAGDPGEG